MGVPQATYRSANQLAYLPTRGLMLLAYILFIHLHIEVYILIFM
jgi:hypothetical protein